MPSDKNDALGELGEAVSPARKKNPKLQKGKEVARLGRIVALYYRSSNL
jgi:hypothetical protein